MVVWTYPFQVADNIRFQLDALICHKNIEVEKWDLIKCTCLQGNQILFNHLLLWCASWAGTLATLKNKFRIFFWADQISFDYSYFKTMKRLLLAINNGISTSNTMRYFLSSVVVTLFFPLTELIDSLRNGLF